MTLKVDRIEKVDGLSGIDTDYVIGGAARFWVRAFHVGIDESLNCSSIVDNGTGDYTFNFTNAFTTVNHSTVGMADFNSTGSYNRLLQGVGATTTSERFYTITAGNGGRYDSGRLCIHIQGDLA
ncbi:hypothetical protein [Terasakiella sp. SH-1]|uniref:hypothetical protein n=1 Tax=Terasakiella sp. SH-1 TaxID=2560057 RepID=UPI001074685E|nr:hypothetical protein [Terasakiella sp. SH-1]